MRTASDIVNAERLGIGDWKAFAQENPDFLASSFLARLERLLSPAQQKAALAHVFSTEALSKRFAGAAMRGALAGVPTFLKDLFPLAGVPTKAGSSFLDKELAQPTEDALLVRRLGSAGAVCAGKTHLHEFAYGVTGQNPNFGDCCHPRHPERSSGGSSSGSAVTVASGVVPFAIGTDTGGSIRVPSAFCGLHGFRHVPRSEFIRDAFPLAPSFDTAGWMTAGAKDLLTLTEAILGPRPSMPGREPRGCYLNFGSLELEVSSAFEGAAVEHCPAADAAARSQLLHAFEGVSRTYTVLTSMEAALAHAKWLDSRRSEYSPIVWQRIDRGRHWNVEEKAQAMLSAQLIRDTLKSYFLTFDFLILPSSPCAALMNTECDRYDRNRIIELNAPASLAGLPVVSIPIDLGDGLSAGMQVVLPSADSPVLSWVLSR